MTVAIDITKEQRKALFALLRRFIPGVAVWAYGSRVKWTARPNSDLDLVAFTSPEQRSLVSELKDELAESSAIPFLVDLHVWDEVPERFREIIRKEYVVLMEADEKLSKLISGDSLFQVACNDWDWLPLGEVCRRGKGDIQTGPFGSQLHAADYVPFGVPSIMPQNISQDRVSTVGIARITPHDAERLSRYLLKAGDIVYSRRGDVERRALITERENGWLCGTGCLRIRFGVGVVEPKFASYFLSHPASREWVVRHAVGATMPNLNTSILGALPFLLPPISEQRAIAAVLGALDDKIESNRRTSRALERVARAIFRAWFVDFEPVKAKSAGARSFPGMPQDAFNALPTRLVESEIGPVPEGWEVGSIGDNVSVRGGGTPSTTVGEYWENGTHCWLTPKDLSGMKDHILLNTARKITDKGVEKISSGLLPVGTVLLSSRAPVGYLVLSGVPTAINQGFIAMVCDGQLPPIFVFHWTQSVMDEIKNRASGTTFPEISKTAFRPIKVCVPTKPILESFTSTVEPLFEKLATNIRESQSLERLRDYLLPKLLSGEVRVAGDSADSILETTCS